MAATVPTADGHALSVERSGDGQAVLLLHGFMGSAAAMGRLFAGLKNSFDVTAVDLLGHGGSDAPEDPRRYEADRLHEDLDAVIGSQHLDRPAIVGYSLGGRLAIGYALARPGRVSALVLIGAGAGIEDAADRKQRVAVDEERARRIDEIGVAAFVDEWRALPLIADQAAQGDVAWQEDRARRVATPADGLKGMLLGFGQGVMPPLWSELGSLDCPLLLVVGGDDAVYRDIAARMAARAPQASVRVIAGTGHAPHVTHPDEVTRDVTRFVIEVEG